MRIDLTTQHAIWLVGLVAAGWIAWIWRHWWHRDAERQVRAVDEMVQQEPELVRGFAADVGMAFLDYSDRTAVFLCRIDRSLLTPVQERLLSDQSAQIEALGFRFGGCVAWCRSIDMLRRVFEPAAGFVFMAANGLDRLLASCTDDTVLGYEAESETFTGEFRTTASSTLAGASAALGVARQIMPEGASLEDLLAEHRRLDHRELLAVTTMEALMGSQRRQEAANRRALLQSGITDEFLDDPEIDVRGSLARSWPLGVKRAARTVFERQLRLALLSWRPSAQQLDAAHAMALHRPEWYSPAAGLSPAPGAQAMSVPR